MKLDICVELVNTLCRVQTRHFISLRVICPSWFSSNFVCAPSFKKTFLGYLLFCVLLKVRFRCVIQIYLVDLVAVSFPLCNWNNFWNILLKLGKLCRTVYGDVLRARITNFAGLVICSYFKLLINARLVIIKPFVYLHDACDYDLRNN